jgi:hypothetical protein
LLDQSQHLARLGVTAQALLREDPTPVNFHFEHAARRLDELDVRVRISLADFGRQTGGSGFIVSDDAVFDRDTHSDVNDSHA